MELVSLEALRRLPVGAAVASAHVVFYFPRPEIRFVSVLGRPDAGDAELLIAAMRAEVEPAVPPHCSFVDLRRLEGIEPPVFERFVSFMAQERARFAARILASAMVVSPSLPSSAAAGYPRLLGNPFPSALFRDTAEALSWLGAGTPEDLATLERLEEQATAGARRALRDLLRDGPLAELGTLETAARRRGRSRRTLQRELTEGGTSFARELAAARVARAKDLLCQTDWKLFAIAAEVGLAKTSSLVALFRREVGVTPGAWRAQRGPGR